MQHLRDESISAVSMLACEHGGEGSMLSCPSGLMARWGLFIWKRECMQITVMPRGWGWGWGGYLTSYFTKIMWPLWSRVAGKLSLNSTFWRGHFLFSHMTVTYRHTWIFIVSLRGLNGTNIKLEKVRFRAFKVFLVLTNMGYYGVKHRNKSRHSFTIRWKTEYLKHTEVILHEGRCMCHCFEGLCDSY